MEAEGEIYEKCCSKTAEEAKAIDCSTADDCNDCCGETCSETTAKAEGELNTLHRYLRLVVAT